MAVLLVLWPTRSGANRFLRRWGIAEPTGQQESIAVRYLRNRRLLYPPLLFLVPSAADALAGLLGFPPPEPGLLQSYAALIIALLLAEAVAAVRPVRGLRVAALAPRRWHDVVPRTAVVILLALFAAAALLAVVDLLAQPVLRRVVSSAKGYSPEHLDHVLRPTAVPVLAGVVIGAAAVFGVVRLAVRRAPTGDPGSDAVLRTRSARVAVGLGMAWAGSLLTAAPSRLLAVDGLFDGVPDTAPAWFAAVPALRWLGLLVFVVSLGGWMWVVNPAKRDLPVSNEGVR
ncbi:hypothetical protein [Actinosynnema sp. NPDC023587]|uniref:hypothetical protein n=1 Tax=Actinosynnema sp. NPDC023587 TaxID=3154695 RepID=UPI0033C7A46F